MAQKVALRSTDTGRAVMLAATLAAASCSALVQPVPLADLLVPIQRATTIEAADLREAAEAGDAQSQLALSIAYDHGLGDLSIDPQAAAMWRGRALSARTYQPITQYTAAFNGQPSRVNIINVPLPVISSAQTVAIDRCLAWLVDHTADIEACGLDFRTTQLRRDWTAAVDR